MVQTMHCNAPLSYLMKVRVVILVSFEVSAVAAAYIAVVAEFDAVAPVGAVADIAVEDDDDVGVEDVDVERNEFLF